MPQDRFNLTGRAALLAAIAAAYPVIGYSAPAARVDFAVGDVMAVGPNGQSRTLGKGAQIEQGDTVNTNGGRAQLRFTDGAYVSLQPQSQFRIDQYRFDGKTDGNEKGFFSLLKGGLRTITGLVGRSNKAKYQISTTVATIGIRGTEYTIQYGQSITGTVGEGEIEVCNGAGCLSVTNGESYYVQTQEVKPVLTTKRTDLPPPEPTQPPANFVQGNNVDSTGNPLFGALLTGTHGDLMFSTVSAFSQSTPLIPPALQPPTGTITFDANGVATAINGLPITNVIGSGNDGIIAWGLGLDSSGLPLHYVTGIPTLSTDLANLAISNPVATYSVLGATSPTAFACGPLVGGEFTGATLSANFATGLVDSSVSVLFGTNNITGAGRAILNRTNGGVFSASGSCTVGVCSFISMKGFFAGVNAIRAGLTYSIFGVAVGSPTGSSPTVSGAVAFTKNP
ncbi:MAG TPA: FecR family protein [Burkholderiales bacterium]|nr:FecR family protein [Burkholderiales bacterium]